MPDKPTHLDLAAGIVSAFVEHNSVRLAELPDLIVAVHAALNRLGAPPPVEEPVPALRPAVPARRSVTPDYLISLEDGKRYKTLRRHLTRRGMTPDDYRLKWGLPATYPMVAQSYSTRRSELARTIGLGSRRRAAAELSAHTALSPVKSEPATLVPVIEQIAPPKRRGRPRKVK